MDYQLKYIKYKNKYLLLKSLLKGGVNVCIENLKKEIDITKKQLLALSLRPKITYSTDFILYQKKSIEIIENLQLINDKFIELVTNHNGLNELLEMKKIKDILKKYLSESSKSGFIDIPKLYDNIINYTKPINYPKEKELFVINKYTKSTLDYHTFMSNKNSILFFLKIMNEYLNIYDGYFLGDSPYKFKNMMEILRPDLILNFVLFSGSYYDRKIKKIKEGYIDKMKASIDDYHLNNKEIMDKLFSNLLETSSKKIVIFDFIDTGYSILTFVEFLKLIAPFTADAVPKVRPPEDILPARLRSPALRTGILFPVGV